MFENPTLAAGTLAVAEAMAEADATTVIGGGDSAAAVMQLGFGDNYTYIYWRRRQPGVPGGQGAARHRLHPERLIHHSGSGPVPGRCILA